MKRLHVYAGLALLFGVVMLFFISHKQPLSSINGGQLPDELVMKVLVEDMKKNNMFASELFGYLQNKALVSRQYKRVTKEFYNKLYVLSNKDLSWMKKNPKLWPGGSVPLLQALVESRQLRVFDYLWSLGIHDDLDALLMGAVKRQNNVDVINRLVELGANPNVQNRAGETALTLACSKENNPKNIQTLLALGADPNGAREDGMTPLMIVCDRPYNFNTVRALLAAGADPRAEQDLGGMTQTIVDMAKRANFDNAKTVQLLKQAEIAWNGGPVTKQALVQRLEFEIATDILAEEAEFATHAADQITTTTTTQPTQPSHETSAGGRQEFGGQATTITQPSRKN
ncbi:MAG: hypothetical protein UU47_C0025G0003 [candidate division TM6 bacterium GW2011_GWE2_41_16]|nr:MAG: hypothetical protein UU47_C0025G0003 [candidate division TM6 bacterium GW2011_GWE2_41_16]